MSAFENATRFFHSCESSEGWEACRQYVEPGATFEAQAGPVAAFDKVREYAEWMAEVPHWATDAGFDIHTSAWDEENRAATFFATYHLRHTGEGGPVPPTNREMNSHYVFVLFMSADDRVEKMYKIWNADWALKQLGWV